MLHSWLESTDGNGATARALLFDFRKAFDLIDHHVLAQKLSSYDFPESIVCWILDFLTNRRQRVKLSCDCLSKWRAVPAGVPQGPNLGPWLFLIMIWVWRKYEHLEVCRWYYPRWVCGKKTEPARCGRALMNLLQSLERMVSYWTNRCARNLEYHSKSQRIV